jgi:hypothetical protein
MIGDEPRRSWGFGLIVTALVLAIVILGTFNLRRWWESRGRTGDAAGAATSEAAATPALPDLPAPGEPEAAHRGPGGEEEPRGRQPDPTSRMTSGLRPQAAGPANDSNRASPAPENRGTDTVLPGGPSSTTGGGSQARPIAPGEAQPEAPWTGKVLVPQNAAQGAWKVRVVRVEDKARNAREYTPADPVLAGAVFEVR